MISPLSDLIEVILLILSNTQSCIPELFLIIKKFWRKKFDLSGDRSPSPLKLCDTNLLKAKLFLIDNTTPK